MSSATVITLQPKANTSSNHTGNERSNPPTKIANQDNQHSKLTHNHDAEMAETPQEPPQKT
jgi:hypothetical protein